MLKYWTSTTDNICVIKPMHSFQDWYIKICILIILLLWNVFLYIFLKYSPLKGEHESTKNVIFYSIVKPVHLCCHCCCVFVGTLCVSDMEWWRGKWNCYYNLILKDIMFHISSVDVSFRTMNKIKTTEILLQPRETFDFLKPHLLECLVVWKWPPMRLSWHHRRYSGKW